MGYTYKWLLMKDVTTTSVTPHTWGDVGTIPPSELKGCLNVQEALRLQGIVIATEEERQHQSNNVTHAF